MNQEERKKCQILINSDTGCPNPFMKLLKNPKVKDPWIKLNFTNFDII